MAYEKDNVDIQVRRINRNELTFRASTPRDKFDIALGASTCDRMRVRTSPGHRRPS